MTKIKFCGLKREDDIDFANLILPEYIGFVFARKSRRYVSPEKAATLKKRLDGRISAVGVFVNEEPEQVAALLKGGVIDIAQLHGGEDEEYISRLRKLTDKPIIKAFNVTDESDISLALKSTADIVLLDSPLAGSGTRFDWGFKKTSEEPIF